MNQYFFDPRTGSPLSRAITPLSSSSTAAAIGDGGDGTRMMILLASSPYHMIHDDVSIIKKPSALSFRNWKSIILDNDRSNATMTEWGDEDSVEQYQPLEYNGNDGDSIVLLTPSYRDGQENHGRMVTPPPPQLQRLMFPHQFEYSEVPSPLDRRYSHLLLPHL